MEFKPTTKKNRIEVVDALRGFALLGVFLANVPFGDIEAIQTVLILRLIFYIIY